MSLLAPSSNLPQVSSPASLLDLGICQPVISWIYPETKQVINELWETKPHYLYEQAYTGWQDDFHQGFLSAWQSWAKPAVTIPPDFIYSYPTSGSTEAIRDSLASLKAQNPRAQVHIFHGEYEGFAEMAKGYALPVVRHDRAHYATTLPATLKDGDAFYISQPSAINGYTWSEFPVFLAFTNKLCPKAKIFVDLCYFGTAIKAKRLVLDSPNIQAVFFSLSKVFGVYYHRIGGVFSRVPCPGLAGNIWFKNMFSLQLGQTLLERFPLNSLPEKYAKAQGQAIDLVSDRTNLSLQPSQAIMLAITSIADPASLPPHLLPLWRGTPGQAGWLRLCLTPTLTNLYV